VAPGFPILLSHCFSHGFSSGISELRAIMFLVCAVTGSKENDNEQTGDPIPYFLEKT
jgi:hypothetical protein